MIVQWCIKGMKLGAESEARHILKNGISCNWWRDVGNISPPQIAEKLTLPNLDDHINRFNEVDSSTGRLVREVTPFISLSAGTVERDRFWATNTVHSARATAIHFGSDFNREDTAYTFVCWTLVSIRPAVEVECVSEEIRELNTYVSYSRYQLQGEIAAKIHVPTSQIKCCEIYKRGPKDPTYQLTKTLTNINFRHPGALTNERDLI